MQFYFQISNFKLILTTRKPRKSVICSFFYERLMPVDSPSNTVKSHNCESHNCGVFGQNRKLGKSHNYGDFASKMGFRARVGNDHPFLWSCRVALYTTRPDQWSCWSCFWSCFLVVFGRFFLIEFLKTNR